MPRTLLNSVLPILLLFACFLGVERQAGAGEYRGTPKNLRTLIAKTSPVLPGDTIWLTEGTYTGIFESFLQGTAESPILIRQKQEDKVIFDGNIQIRGAYTWWWGFEVTNTNPNRALRGTGVETFARGTRLINLTIHDCGQGIGSWDNPDCEVYGCIIYHNGYVAPDRNHGHGLYVQNGTGEKRIEDNILTNGLSYGIHAYGQRGKLEGLVFKGNFTYNNQATNFHVGGTRIPINNLTLENNIAAGGGTNYNLGYNAKGHQGLRAVQNVSIGGTFQVARWKGAIQFRDNTVYSSGDVITYVPLSLTTMPLYPDADWNYNHYFTPKVGCFATDGKGWATLAQWQEATKWDANSTRKALPANYPAQVWIRKNKYEEGRGHIAVYAPSKTKQRMSVDISSIVTAGKAFSIYRIPEMTKPVLTGTGGRTIALPATEKAFSTYLVISK